MPCCSLHDIVDGAGPPFQAFEARVGVALAIGEQAQPAISPSSWHVPDNETCGSALAQSAFSRHDVLPAQGIGTLEWARALLSRWAFHALLGCCR